MIWFIVFAVIGAALTDLTHEGSHAVVMKWTGGTITSFKPYPHMHKKRFYLGYVKAEYPRDESGKMIIPEDYHYSHVAPYIKAALLGPMWAALGLLYLPLLMLAVWELIDGLWWLYGYSFGSKYTDAQKWRKFRP